MCLIGAYLLGMTYNRSPLRTMPASLFPIAMVPISLYLSITDILNGPRGSLGRGSVLSRTSKRVPPLYLHTGRLLELQSLCEQDEAVANILGIMVPKLCHHCCPTLIVMLSHRLASPQSWQISFLEQVFQINLGGQLQVNIAW